MIKPDTYTVTIGGVPHDIQVGWTLTETVNGRSKFTADVVSLRATYRPVIGDEIILTENGVRIFGGIIDTPVERGFGKGYGIVTRISAVDFNALADRRHVIGGKIPAGYTLAQGLAIMLTILPGVTMDPLQVNGPALPLIEYGEMSVTEVFNQFSVITGYIWNIDYNKRLRMYAVGDVVAPMNLTTASGVIIGDVEVETSREGYANCIIVRAGTGTSEITESLTSTDGLHFPLRYRLYSHRGYLSVGSGGGLHTETIGDAAPHWVYDAATNMMVRATATVEPVSITFIASFPFTAVANDFAQQATEGIQEKVIDAPDVFSADVAQAMAEGYLVRSTDVLQTVRYSTRALGFHAGQAHSMVIPERNIIGTFLITDVTTSNPADDLVIRSITATGGALYHGSWRDDLQSWSGGASGSTVSGTATMNTGSAGHGTTGTLSKWVTGNTLGDSLLSENLFGVSSLLPFFAPQFVGSGSGLTNLPASELIGTINWPTLPAGAGVWNATPTIAGPVTLSDDLIVDRITSHPGTNGTIAPAGDLVLDPGGDDVLPALNYDITLGGPSSKFKSAHIAELVVDTLVASTVRSTIGGRIMVAPTTELLVDLATSDTTIAVRHNILAVGDILHFEARGNVEFMAVTGVGGTIQVPWLLSGSISLMFAPTLTAYTFTVTRNLDGTGANDWMAGDGVVNTRSFSFGFIDLYATSGVLAGVGPTIVGNVRTGSTYNQIEPRWAIGNLNGLYGYGTNLYGAAFGSPAAAWLKIDAANGIRIGHNTTTKISLDPSGNATFSGALSAATGTFSGALSGATGTFAGTLSAAGGSFASGGTVVDGVGVTIGAYGATDDNKRLIVKGKNALDNFYSIVGVNSNSAITLAVANNGATYVGGPVTIGAQFGTVDPFIVQMNNTTMCRIDANGDWRPEADNTRRIGTSTNRYTLVRAVTITSGDIGFENGWAFTESYKVGIADPGVALVNEAGDVMAFFGASGSCAMPMSDVHDLAYTPTTADDRAQMDHDPESRVVGYDENGIEIHGSADDVLPMPNPGQSESRRMRLEKRMR